MTTTPPDHRADGLGARWVMRDGDGVRASLSLIHYEGRVALLKSFDHIDGVFRRLAGGWLIAREAAAYRALAGVDGVPALLARRGRTALVIGLVDGQSCWACTPDQFDAAFFDHLGAVLAAARERGVLHGDVKRNVIRAPDGRPWLVDFGASFVIGPALGWCRPSILRVAALYDARAVAKLKRDVAPHLLTSADLERLRAPLPLARVVKSVEHMLRWGHQAVAWWVGRGLAKP